MKAFNKENNNIVRDKCIQVLSVVAPFLLLAGIVWMFSGTFVYLFAALATQISYRMPILPYLFLGSLSFNMLKIPNKNTEEITEETMFFTIGFTALAMMLPAPLIVCFSVWACQKNTIRLMGYDANIKALALTSLVSTVLLAPYTLPVQATAAIGVAATELAVVAVNNYSKYGSAGEAKGHGNPCII